MKKERYNRREMSKFRSSNIVEFSHIQQVVVVYVETNISFIILLYIATIGLVTFHF